jgi:hypothetical protein
MTRRINAGKAAGKIAFDDRGNAIYEWADKVHGTELETTDGRLRALDNVTLALAEEDSTQGVVRVNRKGLRQGYNPYESGILPKDRWRPRKDLRELSRWIVANRTSDDD